VASRAARAARLHAFVAKAPSEWARAGTALALWIGVPLLIGLWRIQRSEIA